VVTATDKKSVSFLRTGSNPVDVFCFNFYFPIEEKKPNPGNKDGLHMIAQVWFWLSMHNTSIDVTTENQVVIRVYMGL